MSSTSSRTSTNDSTSSSTFRVNYSEYVADITGSPKSTRKLPTTGIGHHINSLQNPNPSRQNQPIQQQQTGKMPQYGGGGEKCARCLKSVYLAERKVGAGRSFHSSCFNCYTCHRKLDSAALSEHKGEIYCKPCYTKQFGAHGLISGVTMSTEQKGTYETRTSRRSSYSSDLDTPVLTYQQTRQRANSTENIFRDDYGTKQNDELSQKYPRDNDFSREQNSSSIKTNNGVNVLVDSKYQRSSSPTGFVIPIEITKNTNRQRSNYAEEDDRKKYAYEGEKLSYGSGASAMVDVPVVVQPRRSDQMIDRMEMPLNPTRDNQRSRSPSVTSNDSYQRQSNLADDYSRLNINEGNNYKNTRKYSDDNTIASENPFSTRDYHQASSSSAYETKYKSTVSNSNNYDREQYHSRESSPSAIVNRNQSPLPASSHISSSTTRTYQAEVSRDSTSPSSTYVPQRDTYNTQLSSNSNSSSRRSSSPQNNGRTSSGLNDFVLKTNLAGNVSPPIENRFSALGAMVNNPRRQNDYNFDN